MSFEEKYPEHVKLEKISNISNAIGEFLEFHLQNRYVIAEYAHHNWCEIRDHYADNPNYDFENDPDGICNCNEDYLTRASFNIEKELAKYFCIDLNKIEKEKKAMLNEIKEALRNNNTGEK